MGSPRRATFRVLFVCTGNICRSPTAEALLRRRIDGIGAGHDVTVESAGVGTENGWRMDQTISQLLDKRGIVGMSGFRSRVLTDALLACADLVLTGTRDHRLRIGKSWPEAYSRTFTLREASSLLESMPAEIANALPGDPVARAHAVLSWLHDERGMVATPAAELDIADPIGRRASVYRRMVEDVSAAVDIVADVLLRPVP